MDIVYGDNKVSKMGPYYVQKLILTISLTGVFSPPCHAASGDCRVVKSELGG